MTPSTPETVAADLLETGDLDFPALDDANAAAASLPSLAIELPEPPDAEFTEPEADAPPIVIEPDRHETARVSRPPKARRKTAPGRRRGKATGAAGSTARHRFAAAALLLLALGLPSCALLRASIVRALPGTSALFAAVGLPVNVLGLRLADVSSSLARETGAPILVVTGRIANPSSAPVTVPPLDLTIEGEQGEVLYTWSTPAPNQDLAPGAETTFRAPLASPPPAGRRVLVAFREGPAAKTHAAR